mmetsp:Transcript_6105/g.8527  ORF Transcript_6105/g.8527 Transcript_6105/m.8527 type:complete len:1139 (-) Transcript_6105:212-3628(-)
MQWSGLEQRLSDRIGTSEFSLFAPDERGWHTCVALRCNVMIVFGGFRYKTNAVPHPFRSHPLPLDSDMECLNDIRVFDLLNQSWHGVQKPEDDSGPAQETASSEIVPDRRYGHVAAALDEDQMLVFGGRGQRGRIFCDTWLYHYGTHTWQNVSTNELIGMPVPSPRYFASCCSTVSGGGRDVYLFGGTDGLENLGDLWLFEGASLRWQRVVAVGVPPSPRYGHSFIAIADDVLAVVGGCAVSLQGEAVGSSESPNQTKALIELSTHLQRRYEEENRMARVGGAALEARIHEINDPATDHFMDSSSLGMGSASAYSGKTLYGVGAESASLKQIYHDAANISATFHELESRTRAAERKLVDTYHMSHAATQFNVQKARHPLPHVDVVFLHTRANIWKTHSYPPISGMLPQARAHFGCCCLGPFIFVMGGIQPTGLAYRPIDSSQRIDTAAFTKVYALNMHTWRWEQPIPVESSDSLKEAIAIATADVIRARRRLTDNKSRGLSQGLLNGRTVELAEAEAVLEVCEWRKQALLREQLHFSTPPLGRWGATLTLIGQRLVYCGGWSATSAIKQGDVAVLNLEQQHERLRRLADEHQAALSRQLNEVNRRSSIEQAQSLFELKARREAELLDLQREGKAMELEDLLSGIPPLSQPTSVRLVHANAHTLWLEWDRITQHNVTKKPVSNPAAVTYSLYMQRGFHNMLPADRVSVVVPLLADTASTTSSQQKKNTKRGVKPAKNTKFTDPLDMLFDDSLRRFEGEVLAAHPSGSFDVLFDDGTIERHIPRHRMKLLHSSTAINTIVNNNNRDNNDGEDDDISAMTTAQSVWTRSEGAVTSEAVRKRQARKLEKKQRQLSRLSQLRSRIDIIETAAEVSILDTLKVQRGGSVRSNNARSVSTPLSTTSSTISLSTHQNSINNSNNKVVTARNDSSTPSLSRRSTAKSVSRRESRSQNAFDMADIVRSLNSRRNNAKNTSEELDDLLDVFGDTASMDSDSADSNALVPTVPPPAAPLWELVYSGSDTCYTCSGVVPLEALQREPHLVVPVGYLLQTHGVDHPDYELSQHSPLAVLHTKNTANRLQNNPSRSEAMPVIASDSPSDTGEVGGVSRKKKEILSAVGLGRKMIQMERASHLCVSQGTAEQYL